MDLEDIGLGAIRKLFRFFKDVKNFGELSKLGKARTIATPTIPLALFLGGGIFVSLESGAAAEQLRLVPAQQVMMDACSANHNDMGFGFGDNMSVAMGCACTAKLVSSVTPPAHYGAFEAVHNMSLESYAWEYEGDTQAKVDREYARRVKSELRDLAKTESVNLKGLTHIHDYIQTAETVCDMRESYEGEALESLAELQPLETPIWESDVDGVVEISLRGADEPIRVSMNQ